MWFYKYKNKFRIYKNPLKKCVDLHDFTDEVYQTSRQELTTFFTQALPENRAKGNILILHNDNITFFSKPDRLCVHQVHIPHTDRLKNT